MGWEIWFLIGIIALSVYFFVSETIPFEVTAIGISVSLMLTGIVDLSEGLSGFSSQAAVTILALLILNNGLEHTGLVQRITDKLIEVTGSSVTSILVLLLPFTAILSAFTNNTAIITMLIPILLALGSKKNISASKLLMPLSFISILGGMCTIIGTSTNLLVNSVARQYGIEPFGFFDFVHIGAILVGVGFVYLLLVGYRLIPERLRANNLEDEFNIKEYLAEMKISENSSLIGRYNKIKPLLSKKELELLRVVTDNDVELTPSAFLNIMPGNRVLLKGSLESIIKVQEDLDFENISEPGGDRKKETQKTVLVEALIGPGSSLIGRRLGNINFALRYNSVPIALNRMGKKQIHNISDFTLKVGDTLLMEIPNTYEESSFAQNDFIFLNSLPKVGTGKKQLISLLIVVSTILLAALGIIPIVLSALAGVVAMAVTGCIETADVYKSIEWKIYFLIAGLIPLGIALQNTGLDSWIADFFVNSLEHLHLLWIILLLFFITVLITNVMANNATALLMAPIAVSIANKLQIDPHSLLLTVMFAASTCFFTPFGYHTLTLIYVPGKYKFKDYLVTGLPLTVLIGVVASLLIWKFYL